MCHFRGLICIISGLFAIIALASCRATSDHLLKPQFNKRIIGGSVISIEQAPWQVSLEMPSHFCGGSIISEKWILTAAHCMRKKIAKSVTVRVGSSTHASNGQLIKVNRIVRNEKFEVDIPNDYDFALLELLEPIPFDATKQPIDLPDDSESVADNTLCTVTGWGTTQNRDDLSNQLRAVAVPIVNQQNCAKANNQYCYIVTPRMICAGFEAGGKGFCRGDSGGPLICNNKLVGIVSWTLGCAEPHSPGIYARVQTARSWIRLNTGI